LFNAIGQLKVTDVKEQIHAVTTFDPKVSRRTGYWTSWVKGSDKLNKETGVDDNRRDLVMIEVCKETPKEKTVYSEGYGSYLESITFGEGKKAQTLWTIDQGHLAAEWGMPSADMIIPSDSSVRPDSIAIKQEKWDEAHARKHELEELQRHDKRLRSEKVAKKNN
jgi:hypothetical protein